MRWTPGLLLALSCSCTGNNGPPSYASSTFDSDVDGWVLEGDAKPQPELSAAGGDPGGNICGTDLDEGDIWYFVAPQKYLGDASSVFGKRITWALKEDTIFMQLMGRDVVLQGNGLSLVYDISETPGTKWHPYSARLDEPGFPVATDEMMKTLLRNVTTLLIRGEYADGPDHECLDNVFFGVD